MRTNRLALVAGLLVASCLVPRGAWAQASLTLDDTKFTRANHENSADNPDAELGDPGRDAARDGINLDECERGEVWHLEATTKNLSGNYLFVYTGTNCSDVANRTAGGDGQDCKLLTDIHGETANYNIDTDSTKVWDLDFAANELANITGSDCEPRTDNVQLWLLVLAAEGDETTVVPAIAYPTEGEIPVDLTPPDPPTDVKTGPGESRSDVEWNGVTDNEKYYVVCSPMPGAQGLAPSGEPTFDASGQETCVGDPPTAGFAAGAALDRTWRCDQGSETFFADGTAAEKISIEGLQNDVQHFFAVVAVDSVGNPSVLSDLACSTPKPVNDFFELYRESGGKAGGGVCAAGPGRPAGGSALALLVGLALVLVRRRRAAATLAAASVVLLAGTASAEGLRYLEDDYRSPQNFAFELRGGPYTPNVDDEFDGSATPFADAFGDHDRLRIGFEVDWQALHTPVGSLGVGFAGSLMRYVGYARFESTGEKSSEETTLIVMPMVVQAVVRLDFAMREWQIPFVPYGKIGFATYLWFSEDGSGTARADGPDGAPNAVLGSGRTHGLELAGGLAFLLDFIEPQSARKLDADTGVNHSYLFAELLWANIDGFGASTALQLGDLTWNAGLLLEI